MTAYRTARVTTTQTGASDPDRPLVWFRFNASFADEPRIRTLPDGAQLTYVLALCATARRITPCSDADFAWWARSPAPELAKIKQLLIDSELISDSWVPNEWNRHQPPIDRTNSERQRRLQQRRRGTQTSDADTNGVTNGVTNGPVTPLQDRTGEDRTLHTSQDRTEESTVVADSNSAAVGAQREDRTIDTKTILPDPTPKSRATARRRSGDFEPVLRSVEQAILVGKTRADDIDGLVRVTGFSRRQVETAVSQLRDRGRV